MHDMTNNEKEDELLRLLQSFKKGSALEENNSETSDMKSPITLEEDLFDISTAEKPKQVGVDDDLFEMLDRENLFEERIESPKIVSDEEHFNPLMSIVERMYEEDEGLNLLGESGELVTQDIDGDLDLYSLVENLEENPNENKDDSEPKVNEGVDTDPLTELEKLGKEISELQFKNKLNDFVPGNINTLINNFNQSSSDYSLTTSEFSLNIQDIITSKYNVYEIKLMYEILNLQENLNIFEEKVRKLDSDFESYFLEIKNNYSHEKDKLISDIHNFKAKEINKLNEIFEKENIVLGNIKNKYLKIMENLKQQLITINLSKHTDLFEEVDTLTEEIEFIKERIRKLLGKRFLVIKEPKIKIPEDGEQLTELINKIRTEVTNLELKDVSFYDKIITKLMSILFFPTKYTTNEMRSVIMLLNTLVVLVLAFKFKGIFTLLFTSTILIDLINQVKLSKKNSNVDYVIEFSMKSDEIIDNIRSIVMNESAKIADENISEVIEILDEKIQEQKEIIKAIYLEKLEEIENLFIESSLVDKVEQKYERFINLLHKEYNKQKIYSEESKDLVKNEIITRLKKAQEKAKAIPRTDIYREGNDGNKIFKPSVKVGQYFIGDGEYGFDLTRSFHEGSYLIQVDTDEDKREALNKVKCILIQHLTYMKPEHLKINFIDVREMGNDFIEMISEEETISKLYSNIDSLTEHLKYSVNEIEKRYKTATKEFENITVYNEEMLKRNERLFNYEINVFYNFEVDLIKNSNFRTLMSEGGKSGLSSVVILNSEELVDQRGEPMKEIINSLDCFDYKITYGDRWIAEPGNKDNIIKGTILPKLQYLNKQSVQFNRTAMLSKIRELENILEESRKDLVFYEDLEKLYAPKLFQKDTLKGIEICVGFRDGNLTKPESVLIGDELVHALMAGKTGAGKSNTINVILMNLLRSYSPEWLELYMIDFKNVEFNFYTETIETKTYTKKVSRLPHTSMIAGTTDAEYALSVFRHALREMERRKKLLAKGIKYNGEITTFKKIQDYNEFVLKHNLKHDYPIIPRILIMLDEFQVMFQIDDADIISTIKSMITRLSKEARAMGIHMFFTSQSMEGTLSEDVKGQFAMRWCLSATADTSKEIIGNDAASKLKGKGFIYMNGTMERKAEDNQLYKVPFIPPDYINKVIDEIRQEATRLNSENPNIPYYKTEFYDEEDKHKDTELRAYLEHPTVKQNRNVVMLGPKVIYKQTSTPEHTVIGTDDGENILVMANDKETQANLFNTLIENFASKERTKILIANFDRTMDGLLLTDKVAEGTEIFIKSSDPMPLLEVVCDLIGVSMNNKLLDDDFGDDDFEDDVEEYNPNVHNRWYIFIVGLNKAQGFNEEYVEDEYMGPLMNILKFGPSKGVTTVLSYKPPFRASKIIPQFAHRIAGKIDEDTSFEMFNNRKAKNLFIEDGLAFGLYRSTVDDKELKFKVYNFNYSKDLLGSKGLGSIEL